MSRSLVTSSYDARQKKLNNLTMLEYLLLGDLSDVLEEPASTENKKWILALVDTLLETLPVEYRLRDVQGLYDEVLQEHPTWDSAVMRIRQEQKTLASQLRILKDSLDHCENFRASARVLKHEIMVWMNRLVQFNQKEKRLLQEAYNIEVGVGD